MKNLLLLFVIAGFVGCSSAEKEETKEMVEQDEQTMEQSEASKEAEDAYNNAKEEVEAAADEMAEEEDAAASADENAEESDDMAGSGNFGPYEGTEKSKVSCTKDDDTRTVAVLDGANGGCGVVYEKFGESKTVAIAEYNMEFCPEVQSKIQSNLESAGFTCE